MVRNALTLGAIAAALLLPLLPLLAVLAVSAGPSVSSAAVGGRTAPAGTVAAFFPPWWSPTRVVLAASEGGGVAGLGARFVAVLPDGDPVRLRAAGAWWVVPAAFLGGCAPIRQENDG